MHYNMKLYNEAKNIISENSEYFYSIKTGGGKVKVSYEKFLDQFIIQVDKKTDIIELIQLECWNRRLTGDQLKKLEPYLKMSVSSLVNDYDEIRDVITDEDELLLFQTRDEILSKLRRYILDNLAERISYLGYAKLPDSRPDSQRDLKYDRNCKKVS